MKSIQSTSSPEPFKYCSFTIDGSTASWKADPEINITLQASASEHCLMEGLWSPSNCKSGDTYQHAIAGVCIWSKYDCVFTFKPRSKGNSSAQRSFCSPRDQEDVIERLKKGHEVEKITISKSPLGTYQKKPYLGKLIRLQGWAFCIFITTFLSWNIKKPYKH
jgi:hypothetical protein